MAANLGTAWIQVKPSMSGVRGSILGNLKGTGSQASQQMGGEIAKSRGMTTGMAVAWGAATAVGLKAISVISRKITQSIDGAVRRVDTLNNASRTFANMGINSGKADREVKNLNKSIMGLPTPLDSAIRGMTALTATYGDITLGRKVFESLNNAILGFGGTADQVDNAITQLSQLPMDGPLDAQTWNSLRNSGITPVLVAMAKESGMSVSEMKKSFGDGKLTVGDFTNKLIELNEKGGGGLVSLKKIAQDSAKGIGTAMANSQTAISRGIANIITALGSEKIAAAITGAGALMEKALNSVAKGIEALPAVIDSVMKSINSVSGFMKDNALAFGAFAVAIGAIAAPMAIAAGSALILDLRIRAMLLWSSVIKVLKGVALGFRAMNAAMVANPIGAVVAAVALLVGAFMLLWKNNEGFRNFFINAWSEISAAFQTAVDFISGAWGDITSAIDIAAGAIKDFIDNGLAVLGEKLGEVKDWLEKNKTALTNIGIVITSILLPKLLQLGGQFAVAAAKSVAAAATAGGSWIAAFATMAAQSAVAAAKSAASAVIAGGAWVLQAAKSAVAWVTTTLPAMILSFGLAAQSAITNAVIAGGAWVMQAGRTVVAWATAFAGYAIGVATAAAQTVAAGIRMAAGWLMALGPIGIIIAVVAGAVALIIANWDTVKNFVVGVFDKIKSAVGTAIEWVKANWTKLLPILLGPVGIAAALIIGNFSKIKAFVASVFSAIANAGGAAWGRIRGAFGAVAGFFSGIFSGAYNAVTGIWGRISGFFSGIVSKIKGVFSGVASIGRDIVNGIAKGLSPTAIVDKMKEIASSALGAVKKFLGIKSPSRVMRDQVGKMMGLGIAGGIANSTKSAVNAAVKQSQAVVSAYGGMNAQAGGISADGSLSAAGGAYSGNIFNITNPSPEQTASIVASRMKGGM